MLWLTCSRSWGVLTKREVLERGTRLRGDEPVIESSEGAVALRPNNYEDNHDYRSSDLVEFSLAFSGRCTVAADSSAGETKRMRDSDLRPTMEAGGWTIRRYQT